MICVLGFFIGAVLAGVLSVFLLIRLVLALPAAAVGNPSRLRDAFTLTEGQMGALFAILLLTSVPAILMSIIHGFWGGEELAVFGNVLQMLSIAVGEHAVGWLVLPVGDADLALAYMHLGGMADAAATPAFSA